MVAQLKSPPAAMRVNSRGSTSVAAWLLPVTNPVVALTVKLPAATVVRIPDARSTVAAALLAVHSQRRSVNSTSFGPVALAESWMVSPTTSRAGTGASTTCCTRGRTSIVCSPKSGSPASPVVLARMAVDPSAIAVTIPDSLTDAASGTVDSQFQAMPGTIAPFASTACASNGTVYVVPMGSSTYMIGGSQPSSAEWTVIPRARRATTTRAVAFFPTLALTVVSPNPTARTSPELSTTATAEFPDSQARSGCST